MNTLTAGPSHPPPWQAPAPRCEACDEAIEADAYFCSACGTPRNADPRLGRVVLERYRLVERLAEGAMGAVYRAEQRVGSYRRSVAVKVLHRELAGHRSARARFEQECALVAGLTHPNTITFYDFGALDDGSLAIVMEYVEGETLSARIARGPIPAAEAIRVARAVGASLAEAHAKGIVHRDLKPDNVMLYRRPGQPDGVKVLDFGVAKRLPTADEPEPTAISLHGELIGTPTYMSPEQVLGDEPDARSDLYSLGLVLYEMLAGHGPYTPGHTLVDWIDKHLYEAPAPLDAAVAPHVREVVMQCLAKEPGDRPADVRELVDRLRGRAPAPTPVVVSAPALVEDDPPRLPKTRRASGLLAAALAAVFAVGAWLAAAGPAGEVAAAVEPPAATALEDAPDPEEPVAHCTEEPEVADC